VKRITNGLLVPAAIAMLSLTALFSGCNLGGGTDVGNPDLAASRVSGSLLRADGSPASWVQIQLRPKTFLPNPDSLPAAGGKSTQDQKSIQDRITDTQGFFTFDSVPKGDYRIQAFDSTFHGVTLEFTADGAPRMTLAAATMDTTGAITGKVAYQGPPRALFPKIYVAIFGMDRWTITNDAGDYTLSDLPPGKYSLSIVTTVNATVLSTTVSDITLTAGGKASAGTAELGP
jgi:hypothetical protein